MPLQTWRVEGTGRHTKFCSHSPRNCWNFWAIRSWAHPTALRTFPSTLEGIESNTNKFVNTHSIIFYYNNSWSHKDPVIQAMDFLCVAPKTSTTVLVSWLTHNSNQGLSQQRSFGTTLPLIGPSASLLPSKLGQGLTSIGTAMWSLDCKVMAMGSLGVETQLWRTDLHHILILTTFFKHTNSIFVLQI